MKKLTLLVAVAALVSGLWVATQSKTWAGDYPNVLLVAADDDPNDVPADSNDPEQPNE